MNRLATRLLEGGIPDLDDPGGDLAYVARNFSLAEFAKRYGVADRPEIRFLDRLADAIEEALAKNWSINGGLHPDWEQREMYYMPDTTGDGWGTLSKACMSLLWGAPDMRYSEERPTGEFTGKELSRINNELWHVGQALKPWPDLVYDVEAIYSSTFSGVGVRVWLNADLAPEEFLKNEYHLDR